MAASTSTTLASIRTAAGGNSYCPSHATCIGLKGSVLTNRGMSAELQLHNLANRLLCYRLYMLMQQGQGGGDVEIKNQCAVLNMYSATVHAASCLKISKATRCILHLLPTCHATVHAAGVIHKWCKASLASESL